MRYSAFDRELFACVAGICHFRYMLEGRLYGAALVLPAEFLSAEEPLAAEFLQKLQQVEFPATRPLSYAEAAAKPPAALLRASHVYVRSGGTLRPWRRCTWAHTRCWRRRTSISG